MIEQVIGPVKVVAVIAGDLDRSNDKPVPPPVNEDTPTAGERAMVQGYAGFMQGVTGELFAALRLRHEAECSVRKGTAFLAEPQ